MSHELSYSLTVEYMSSPTDSPHRGVHEVRLVLVLHEAAGAHEQDVRPGGDQRDIQVRGVDVLAGGLELAGLRMHLRKGSGAERHGKSCGMNGMIGLGW